MALLALCKVRAGEVCSKETELLHGDGLHSGVCDAEVVQIKLIQVEQGTLGCGVRRGEGRHAS